MEETISLKELFTTLRKRLWLILSITVVATITAALLSYFVMTPIYQSSTQILVNQTKSEQNPFNYSDIRTNVEMINTYSVIIKSPRILDKVSSELEQKGYKKTTGQLAGSIRVQSERNSQVFAIYVEDADPALAVLVANTTAEVFQREIMTIMSVDNVSILAQAQEVVAPNPIKPNPALNTAIALVVGLMAGVGLAFLLEYLDNTVKTEQDIEKLLGLPVLGTITKMDLEKERKLEQQAVQTGGETIGA
jgi:capsular polysaccharide biosynthesis protein